MVHPNVRKVQGGRRNPGIERRTEIEAEVEPTEASDDLFPLQDELELVSCIRQFVLPMADILGTVDRLARVEPVRQFDQLLPLSDAGSDVLLGR
jgi:hypothetical protein